MTMHALRVEWLTHVPIFCINSRRLTVTSLVKEPTLSHTKSDPLGISAYCREFQGNILCFVYLLFSWIKQYFLTTSVLRQIFLPPKCALEWSIISTYKALPNELLLHRDISLVYISYICWYTSFGKTYPRGFEYDQHSDNTVSADSPATEAAKYLWARTKRCMFRINQGGDSI